MPRFGSIISGFCVVAAAVYFGNTFYSLYNLFHPEVCNPSQKHEECIYPLLDKKSGEWPLHGLRIRVSPGSNPFSTESIEIYRNDDFDVRQELDIPIIMPLNEKLRKKMDKFQIFAFLLPSDVRSKEPSQVEEKLVQSTNLVTMKIPEATTFKLISNEDEENATTKPKSTKKTPHLRSRIFLASVEDKLILPIQNMPPEVIRYLKLEKFDGKHHYYPIFAVDEMSSRIKDLVEIEKENATLEFIINHRPVSIGKFRLLLQGQSSFQQFKQLGFSEKDFDEVKGIFTDTNFYFLLLTVFVSTIHLLLDVLSFKNDISFWRSRNSMVGLSTKTLIWRSISQIIIFLYLFEEKTSLLVLLPSGFAIFVEVWKLTKAFKIEWTFSNGIFWPKFGTDRSKAEKLTDELDSEAMHHLSKLMIPLCIGGAIYSLIYVPHKSWYSWMINCLANGVYAFGFLFMLPQLFLNYKLKSVAHLPWRAFMYKAFNTFIDDMFAFIISMPTAHRIACFRDDIVFLIYLYQRYLYPVDKNRVNEYGQTFDDDAKNKKNE